MAALVDALHSWNFDTMHMVMIFCAVAVPALAGWLIAKFLAPYFSRSLSRLNTNNAKAIVRTDRESSLALSEKLAPLFCSGNYEKAVFEKVWKMTSRDKGFRMQFYPALAYIPVFIFVIFFRKMSDVSQTVASLPETNMYLWLLYLGVFSIMVAFQSMRYYENFEASWVYQSSPITSPGHIISGSMKTLLVKFFLPVYVVLAGIALFVWGIRIIDDVLLAYLNSILMFYLITVLSKNYLPFSQQQNAKDQSGRFVLVILQMILIAVLAGLHYVALKIQWLPFVLIPLSATGIYFAHRNIRQLQWSKIVI